MKHTTKTKHAWRDALTTAERRAYYYGQTTRKRARILGINNFKCSFRDFVHLFEEVERLEAETGETYEIDHVIPLSHAHNDKRILRRLMKANNLQVLSKVDHDEKTRHNNQVFTIEKEAKRLGYKL